MKYFHTTRRPRLRRLFTTAAVICGLHAAVSVHGVTQTKTDAQPGYTERALFLTAKRQLAAGQRRQFERSLAGLGDYSIAPYLRYYDLRRRIDSASTKEMNAFLTSHADLPITPLLRIRWLKRIGAKAQWAKFLKQYAAADLRQPNSTLQCYRLRALYATGEKQQALDGVAKVWVAGKSLPKACDPIFDLWIDAGKLTNTLVWERLSLALQARERVLARYLLTLLPEQDHKLGLLYYQAHQNPLALEAKLSPSKPLVAKQDTAQTRQIVMHGLQRLLRRDELEAAERWWQAHAGWSYNDKERAKAEIDLALERGAQGAFPKIDQLSIDAYPEAEQQRLAVGLATAAVRAQNWTASYYWIDQLDSKTKASNRWQYWLARSIEATTQGSDRSELTLASLAQRRDYYGFLAAQRLQQPPVLNRTVAQPDTAAEAQLRADARFVRATELYAVREYLAANREWRTLLQQINQPQRAAAARLANAIGWPRQAIEAANRAQLHDDTDLRFPVLHMAHYQRMSHATNVPVPLLLAVSRQESAFDERARSHANARGLMQLLPSTAAQVARRANLTKPTNTSLYRPSTNIEIASHYLATLLARFGGSRPLAIAGYNAGEHRVDRWLAQSADMPMDVWIERIPFRETRNYVQNVLAFTQVYNQKLDVDAPLLNAAEMKVPTLNQSVVTQDSTTKGSSSRSNPKS